MLTIVVPGDEVYDEETSEFHTVNDQILQFEHSLVSLSKWESDFQKPFLTQDPKTEEELFAYLVAMMVTPNAGPDVLYRCTEKNLDEIQRYIDSPQSATTFGEMPERRGRGETITSELIYYWMVAFNIPFECQHWHLNRLFSLIRICNIKNSPPKKRSTRDIAMERRRINEERRAKLATSG